MKIIILVLSMFAIIACFDQKIYEGKVVSKKHIESWTQIIPIMSGKVLIMTPIFHPETWNITIAKEINGKMITNSFKVEKDIYDTTSIGNWISLKKENK